MSVVADRLQERRFRLRGEPHTTLAARRLTAAADRVKAAGEALLSPPRLALPEPIWTTQAQPITFAEAVRLITQRRGMRVVVDAGPDGHPHGRAGASLMSFGVLSYVEDERTDERSGCWPDQTIVLSLKDQSFITLSRALAYGVTWRPSWQELVICQRPAMRFVIEFGDDS